MTFCFWSVLFVLFFVETLVVDDVGAMGENKKARFGYLLTCLLGRAKSDGIYPEDQYKKKHNNIRHK